MVRRRVAQRARVDADEGEMGAFGPHRRDYNLPPVAVSIFKIRNYCCLFNVMDSHGIHFRVDKRVSF